MDEKKLFDTLEAMRQYLHEMNITLRDVKGTLYSIDRNLERIERK